MPYSSVTRATLRARLQDKYTADPFWSNTEANDALNEAMRYFNLFTGYWRGSVTVVTVANTPFITVPSSMTYRTRVWVNGRPLTIRSIPDWYRTRPNWRTQTLASGAPVPSTIREWAPIGLTQIAIWPTDNVGGTTLNVDAVKITPTLTTDGTFLDLGSEELELIIAEALWILSFKRPSLLTGSVRGGRAVDSANKWLHTFFLKGCLERNDQLRASAYFKASLGLDQAQRLLPARVPSDTSSQMEPS